MGVNLSSLLPKKAIEISDLHGKIIGIDALNTLYQFLSIIRQKDGTPLMDNKGNITSHLSGIFYRGINLMDNGLRLVFVFDGKPPELKAATSKERSRIRKEAYEKWQEAKEKGELEDARKYAQAAVKITPELLEESKELLGAMGIPVIQALSEGEAQLAAMNSKGSIYATASSDYDALLFGTTRLVRNISITGRRRMPGGIYREITPEIIRLKEVLDSLKITREQLIILGILVGTDYNPKGIKGIGPKTALKLVREHKTLDKVLKQVEWNFAVSPESIYDFFLKPPISKKYSVKEGKLDKEKIKKILCDKHDFSWERIENTLNKLLEKKQQSSLGKWA